MVSQPQEGAFQHRGMLSGVIKLVFLTLNQALEGVAMDGWGLFLKLTCGTVKTVFPT